MPRSESEAPVGATLLLTGMVSDGWRDCLSRLARLSGQTTRTGARIMRAMAGILATDAQLKYIRSLGGQTHNSRGGQVVRYKDDATREITRLKRSGVKASGYQAPVQVSTAARADAARLKVERDQRQVVGDACRHLASGQELVHPFQRGAHQLLDGVRFLAQLDRARG